MPTPEPTPQPTVEPTPFPTPYPTPAPTFDPTMPPTPSPTPSPDLCGPYDGDADSCNENGPDTESNCFYQTWGGAGEIDTCNDCGECAISMDQPACIACVLGMNFGEYCLLGWQEGCPGNAPTRAPTPMVTTTKPPTKFPCSGYTDELLCDLDPTCYTYEEKYMYFGFGVADGECVDCSTCLDITIASCIACALQQPKSTYCASAPNFHGCGGPTQSPSIPPTLPPTLSPTAPEGCTTYTDRGTCISVGCVFKFNRCYDGVTFPCESSTPRSCKNNPMCKITILKTCIDVNGPDNYSCEEVSAVPLSSTFKTKNKFRACKKSRDPQGEKCMYDKEDYTCINSGSSVCADWSRSDCRKAHRRAPPPSDGPCIYGTASQICMPWQELSCKKLAATQAECEALVPQGCIVRLRANGGFQRCLGSLRI